MTRPLVRPSLALSLWHLIRGPFLILTPVSVALAAAVAYYTQGSLDGFKLFFTLLAATAAHISVNLFNEHHDFVSGLDKLTPKTPFSGGSGVLLKQPHLINLSYILAWVTLLLSVVIGTYLIYVSGWVLLPLGLLGVVLVYSYTGWITHRPLACLLAPGLGFGCIMVGGSCYVFTGTLSGTALVASSFSASLVSSLLLLNQIPDRHADQQVGRRSIPIVYGLSWTVNIYGLLMALSFSVIVVAVLCQVLPISALISLLILPVAIYVFILLKQIDFDRSKPNSDLIQILSFNTLISVVTPVLLSLGLIWA